MLKHLSIQNYALIQELVMEPSGKLNVVTGETGAGKSIMLGAIGLLTGNRADTKALWDEKRKCIIEGTFGIKDYNLQSTFQTEDLDYDDLTVIRRELSSGGKSRAFINDTPVTLEVMKRIGNLLMDIHSQHETLQLGQQSFQLKLVDAYAGNKTLRNQFSEAWALYVKSKKEFESLTREADTLRQEADYVRFQLDELTKVELQESEQETLESDLKIMEHTSEIKSRFQQALELITESEYASRKTLSEARNHLQHIAAYAPNYTNLFHRLESVIIEIDDLAMEMERQGETIEFDPERIELVKERLSTIYRLFKKHKVQDVKDLLKIQERLEQKDTLTANLDEALNRARNTFDQSRQNAMEIAEKISESRSKIFAPLCKKITTLLKDLGIPNATLQINGDVVELSAQGIDTIDILFSANKGIAPKSLSLVASGGEFSRLMFCIKYVMAEKTAMPTLVLDEIDNGVSGEIAIKLGSMMKMMSQNHQLITISHLPQIAAKGDAHYFVFKDHTASKTVSSIKLLDEDERVKAIARMIGGDTPSKVAMQNAQELLTN
jgi:DNA repair protein RecN (Recombination protein N)